jgi:predicted histidine transporter YuiF (NhaC family)
MDINFIVLIITLCFTMGLALHIVVERQKDKKHKKQMAKDKQKRIRETLKRLDWNQKV